MTPGSARIRQNIFVLLITPPKPRHVITPDGRSIATYDSGSADAPAVLAVHGFASSGVYNWYSTGWVRDLTRAGLRVIAIDQRGHGDSDKPHEPGSYTMDALVADALAVLDTYMLGQVGYLGYSLGARVGWRLAHDYPERVSRAVLGGIPDGDPLTRLELDAARAHIADGTPIADKLTRTYLTMAAGIPDNDLLALVSLAAGMRGELQPSAANAPQQPVLFATGTEDPILEASRKLSQQAPAGSFFEIPGRHHFNAPTSREFRAAGVAFLRPASA